jgi:hypothetical protein
MNSLYYSLCDKSKRMRYLGQVARRLYTRKAPNPTYLYMMGSGSRLLCCQWLRDLMFLRQWRFRGPCWLQTTYQLLKQAVYSGVIYNTISPCQKEEPCIIPELVLNAASHWHGSSGLSFGRFRYWSPITDTQRFIVIFCNMNHVLYLRAFEQCMFLGYLMTRFKRTDYLSSNEA